MAFVLPSCGESAEKEALRVYESAVEAPMGEDEAVTARLKDLWEDILSEKIREKDQVKYGREQALPFYRRFAGVAAGLAPAPERLAKAHGILKEYVARRIAYLETVEGFIGAQTGPEVVSLGEKRKAWQEALEALARENGGRITDAEAAQAHLSAQAFLEKVYPPFLGGQLSLEMTEQILRQKVLPPVEAVAARLSGDATSQGEPGAMARWALFQSAYFREIAATLPRMEAISRSGRQARDGWEESQKLRLDFLDRLGAFRESAR
jgi:hypothetical protein